MKVHKGERITHTIYFGGILLVGLMCILNLFDAPEYVHCTHLGVCEFLELPGNVSDPWEAEAVAAQSRIMAKMPSITPPRSSLLDTLYTQNHYLGLVYGYNQEDLALTCDQVSGFLPNRGQAPHTLQTYLSYPVLQIRAGCIMRS
jgi:hypothetical protein